MKINDKVELLINDEVLTGKVSTITTRETDREIMEYYTIDLTNKGWSVSISNIKNKEK